MNADFKRLVCKGYSRAFGKPGIRNKLLIVYTVECSHHICGAVLNSVRAKGFDADCIGNDACACNDVITRQLKALVDHPNVGAVLTVGMGCEGLQPDLISSFAAAAGKPYRQFNVIDEGGTENSINKGVILALELLDCLAPEPDIDVLWSDISIGAECGGSDFSSLIAANNLVGAFMDFLVSSGGTGFVGELTEAVGLKDFLVSRGKNDTAKKEISLTYDKMMRYCKCTGRYSISPGNFIGGLSTIEEKSIGAVAKSGTSPIEGILKLGQYPPHGGMWLVDEFPDYEPAKDVFRGGDASSMMNLISSGCQIVLLTTGRGHIAGTPVSPTVKLTGNSETYRRMKSDIDFDASGIIDKEQPLEELLVQFVNLIEKILNGKPSFAEKNGTSCVSLPFNNQLKDGVIKALCY